MGRSAVPLAAFGLAAAGVLVGTGFGLSKLSLRAAAVAIAVLLLAAPAVLAGAAVRPQKTPDQIVPR